MDTQHVTVLEFGNHAFFKVTFSGEKKLSGTNSLGVGGIEKRGGNADSPCFSLNCVYAERHKRPPPKSVW